MNLSGIPIKFTVDWAAGASGTYVRTIPVTTAVTGAASFTQGFPPVTAQAIASGGIPPDIRDFNGAYQIVTQWLQWLQAGGPVSYDSAFAAAVGGYPKGAIIASTTLGTLWQNQVDANTSNPDTGGANWLELLPIPPAGLPTAPSKTFLSNLTGSSGQSSWNTVASVLASLGFSVTTAASGYAFNLGICIIQAGQTAPATVAGGAVVVTLPLAWPNAAFTGCAGATTVNNSGSIGPAATNLYAQVVSVGASTITVTNNNASASSSATAYPINWWCIGH